MAENTQGVFPRYHSNQPEQWNFQRCKMSLLSWIEIRPAREETEGQGHIHQPLGSLASKLEVNDSFFFFLKSPIKLLRHKLSLLQNSISCRVIFRCCTVLSDYNYHNTAWLPKQRPRVERRPSSPHLTTSPPKTRETLMQPVFEQSGTRQSRGLPLGMLWSSEGWEEKRRWCIVASAVSEGSWWPSPLRSIFFFSNLLPISSVNI